MEFVMNMKYCTVISGKPKQVPKKCEHGRSKHRCRDCGGSGICEHDNHRSYCKQCNGSQVCPHSRRLNQCKKCNGSQICPHDKRRSICKECKGSQVCPHGKQKPRCIACGGTGLCEHGRQKSLCRDCGGTGICEHGNQKAQCTGCGTGSSICKTPLCSTLGNPKYKKYCFRCFVHLFPNDPIIRNYKTKELSVVDFIKSKFPEFDWTTDRKIEDGCSNRRPDMLLDLGYKVIIIEVDENRHTSYTVECETRRLNDISLDLGCRPIQMIRFNPDSYTNSDCVKVTSCWAIHGITKLMCLKKTKIAEWENRLNTLESTIRADLDISVDGIISITELFY